MLAFDAAFEGEFFRDGVSRIVTGISPLANGEVIVRFDEWAGDARTPERGSLPEMEWSRWVAWAERRGVAPRAPAPSFVDCPMCAFRVERGVGFGPGDQLGCPECKVVFRVKVEAVAVGVPNET